MGGLPEALDTKTSLATNTNGSKLHFVDKFTFFSKS